MSSYHKFILILLLYTLACTTKSNNEDFNMFNDQIADFGHLKRGQSISKSFKFKNTTNDDLRILKVAGSCGCTRFSYKKDAIKPGEESSLLITYNSDDEVTGKIGALTKTVIIETNSHPSLHTLQFKVDLK